MVLSLGGYSKYEFSSGKIVSVKSYEDCEGIVDVSALGPGSWKISIRRVEAIAQDRKALC